MEDVQPGALFTFHLAGEAYGLGCMLIYDDNIAGSDRYHVAVYDTLLSAGPGGVDEYGDPFPRTHELPQVDELPVLIDHLSLTGEAISASDLLVVGEQDIKPRDLLGYRLWLQSVYDNMVKAGMIRHASQDEEQGEEYDDQEDLEDEYAEEENIDEDQSHLVNEPVVSVENGDIDSDDNGSTEVVEMAVRPWHLQTFTVPIGQVLALLRDNFTDDERASTQVGAFIVSIYSGENTEVIDELVARLLDGDFGAGHELMEYGDAAAGALATALEGDLDEQQAEDILNILADLGTIRAYEAIVVYLKSLSDQRSTPVGIAAARAFCHAVMLTGGAPEPLKENLALLDEFTSAELAGDVAHAREAVATVGITRDTAAPLGVADSRSSSPFGSL